MDQTVGVEPRIFFESIPHRRLHVGVSPGNHPEDEVTAGRSLDHSSDPMESVGIMRSEIGLRFAVCEKPEGSGRCAAGDSQDQSKNTRK